jgi:hypothetical protein
MPLTPGMLIILASLCAFLSKFQEPRDTVLSVLSTRLILKLMEEDTLPFMPGIFRAESPSLLATSPSLPVA